MRTKLLDLTKFLIGWPISIVSIIFLLKFLPASIDIFSRLKTINWPVILLSVFFFQLYFTLRGFLWQKILRLKGYELSLKNTLFIWEFSELKRYAPGNIWSLIGRVFLFGKLGVKNKDIVSSLIIESEIIIVSAIIVSLLSLNFLFTVLPLPPFRYWIFAQSLIFAATVAIVFLFVFNKNFFKKNLLPDLKSSQILNLLFISSLSLLSFGVGTYFAGAALFFLDPHNFMPLVGLYVFALLLGYLSIITPMGLGVREGVITAVLSKTINLSSAALISIFVRIVFVISELIFLSLAWVFYKTKNEIVMKTYAFVLSHKHEFLLSFFILFYFIYFTSASFLRYDAFFTGRFDLGNMDQTVWNTIHGRIFELTNPNGTDIISRLAFHADFLLVLISPLYWFWNNPKMLLLIQTVVVSSGAIFIYLLSQRVLKNKSFSLILSLAFLLNPALQYSNLYDFHPVVLATTFLLAAFYFMKSKHYVLMLVFLFLSGISKENIWVITSLFGLYLTFIEKKMRIMGILIFIFSIFLSFYFIWIAIPKIAGSQHFALSYYSDFGDSPTKIIKNMITSPIKTVSTMFKHDQIIYLLQLFQPLGFLPILSPLYALFAAPSLLIDLLSNNSQLHKIYYQYSSSITPFLFIATIYSIRFLKKRVKKISLSFYAMFLLVSTIISAYSYGPMIGAKNASLQMFTEDLTNNNLIDKFLQRVPKRYAVAATNEVGSHLSHRQKIYTLPLGLDKADVVVLYSSQSFDVPSEKANKKIINKLLNDDNYFLVYRDYEFVVFKKKGLRRSFYYF